MRAVPKLLPGSPSILNVDATFSANAQPYRGSLGVTADRSAIDVMAAFGILQAYGVAELLRLRE
jgi:hypothetical protein